MSRKTLFTLLGVFAVVAVLSYIFVIHPALRIRAKAMALQSEIQVLKADVKSNDIDLIKKHMGTLDVKYKSLKQNQNQSTGRLSSRMSAISKTVLKPDDMS